MGTQSNTRFTQIGRAQLQTRNTFHNKANYIQIISGMKNSGDTALDFCWLETKLQSNFEQLLIIWTEINRTRKHSL